MSLQHLPTEVIQKIAGYCEVTDISYLSRTCRVIHEAVEDPAVFRESVFHALPAKLGDDRAAVFALLKKQIGAGQASSSAWKSMGIALLGKSRSSLYGAAVKSRDNLFQSEAFEHAEEELTWAIGAMVALTVLGYTNVCSPPPGANLLYFSAWDSPIRPTELQMPMSFFLTCEFLEAVNTWWQPRNRPEGGDIAPEMPLYPPVNGYAFQLAMDLQTLLRSPFLPDAMDVSSSVWDVGQTYGLCIANLIAFNRHGEGRHHDLPKLHRIPFISPGITSDSTFSLPVFGPCSQRLYASDVKSLVAWSRSRVSDMVDRVCDEEWYGYYSNGHTPGTQDSQPMRNVRFKWTSNSANSRHSLQAVNATDGVGPFTFTGVIEKPSGRASLVKQYTGAHAWQYEGIMTPCGLCGWWGLVGGTGPESRFGLFWLWPIKWSEIPEQAT